MSMTAEINLGEVTKFLTALGAITKRDGWKLVQQAGALSIRSAVKHAPATRKTKKRLVKKTTIKDKKERIALGKAPLDWKVQVYKQSGFPNPKWQFVKSRNSKWRDIRMAGALKWSWRASLRKINKPFGGARMNYDIYRRINLLNHTAVHFGDYKPSLTITSKSAYGNKVDAGRNNKALKSALNQIGHTYIGASFNQWIREAESRI